jgi:hypothetical protein
VVRRPRGALAAGSWSTYCPPWERVSADMKENVQPLPEHFSSFFAQFISKMAMPANRMVRLPRLLTSPRQTPLATHGRTIHRVKSGCLVLAEHVGEGPSPFIKGRPSFPRFAVRFAA